MKTQRFFLGLAAMILLTLPGCESNGPIDPPIDSTVGDSIVGDYRTHDVLYPKNAKLKRIYQVFSDNTSQVFAEYEYDETGRISKISSGNTYLQQYEYNANNQLVTISYYNKDEVSPYRTISYTYDGDGNKIKELTDPLYVEPNRSGYILYKYENNKLIRSEHYTGDKLDFYQLHEYNDAGEMVKVSLQVPNEEGEVIMEYTYREKLLVYTIAYSGEKSNFLSDSRKIYDLNDNLIMVINNLAGLSNAIPSTTFCETRRYEY